MYPAAAASSPTGMASMLGFRAMHHRAADISFLVHVRMKAAVFLQVIMVGTRAKLIFSRDQGNHSQRNAYPCQHRHQCRAALILPRAALYSPVSRFPVALS